MMHPTDLADATARALDLLDPEDLANSDPRIFRDPHLAGETRQTREAAAEVWLAVSPLRVAPAEVLHGLMEKINPPSLATPRSHREIMPWLAASGWAAAVALAFFLWPAPSVPSVLTRQNTRTTSATTTDPAAELPIQNHPTACKSPIRREITRLQERLASVQQQQQQRSGTSPRIIHLTAPGTVRRTAEESRQRVHSILIEALRTALEADRATPADPAELVIERGWLPGGLPLPADGGTIRHRNFPERAWQEMGLLRSESGEYLDATAKTLWSAAADGRGFTGRKIAEDEDVSRFSNTPSPTVTPVAEPRTAPEGFIIESPTDHKAEVVIDQVPPPAPGSQQVVVLTDSSGKTHTIPLTPPAPPSPPGEERITESVEAPTGRDIASNESPEIWISNAATFGSGLITLSLTGSEGVYSFQLIERPIVSDGKPATIIVEGRP